MTGDLLLIFVAPAHRCKTVPPEVCPNSFATDSNSVFHCSHHSTLPLSSLQTTLLPAFDLHPKSLKPHSNRIGIPDTASFM